MKGEEEDEEEKRRSRKRRERRKKKEAGKEGGQRSKAQHYTPHLPIARPRRKILVLSSYYQHYYLSLLPVFSAGGGRSGVRVYKVLALLLFLPFVFCCSSRPPGLSSSSLYRLHLFTFFAIFCVFSIISCKMRSPIAYRANNLALPSTISRKLDPAIAKSRVFLAHVSAPNLTNAPCP